MNSSPNETDDASGANPPASSVPHTVVKRSSDAVVNPTPENSGGIDSRESRVVLREDPGVDAREAARFIGEVFGTAVGHIEIASFLTGQNPPLCAFRRIGERIERAGGPYNVTPQTWADAIAYSDRRGLDPKRRPNPADSDLTAVDAWYIRMTTLAAEPCGSQRGGKTNVREFFGFWLDGDYDVPGHHEAEDRANPLPPNADTVLGIWTACGYPEPSVMWHTGGGVNGLWLLEEPVVFSDDDQGRAGIGSAQQASDRWHARAHRTAAEMGWHHDTTANLDRLMRLPGSANRKDWAHPKPVTAEYTGQRYRLSDLLALIPEPVQAQDGSLVDPRTGAVVAPPKPLRLPAARNAPGSPSDLTPWSDFDERGDWWGDVLAPLGFTHYGWAGGTEGLYRPGKSSGSQSATLNHDGHDKLHIFSSTVLSTHKSCEPYTDRYLTKSQVWCHMVHGGDWKACAADLRARGYGGELTSGAVWNIPKPYDVPAPEEEGGEEEVEEEGEEGGGEDVVHIPPARDGDDEKDKVSAADVEASTEFMYNVREYLPDQLGQARYFCDAAANKDFLRWNLNAGAFMAYDNARGYWNQDDQKGTITGARVTKLGIRISDATETEVKGSKAYETVQAARKGVKVGKEELAAAKSEITGMRSWAKVYASAGGNAGILSLTRTIVDQCTALDFDTHPPLINFTNGTFDVRLGKLRPHQVDDMLAHVVGHDLDMTLAQKPLAEAAPHFYRLVTRMCAAEGEVDEAVAEGRVQAVLRMLGYALHGSNPEKKMMIFEGGTDIGKNQVLEIVGQLLGQKLSWLGARPQLLIEGKGDRHDAEEYGLAGRRLVLVNEMREGQVLDESQVLRFVGPEGTQVGLRRMRQDREDHWITWTLFVTTNELPRSRMTPQIINRLLVVPLSRVPVPKADQYDIKGAVLAEESAAVLAHLVKEWKTWWTAKNTDHSPTGLVITDEMTEALSGYVEGNKPLELEFMDEMTERGKGIPMAAASALWSAFQGWAKSEHPNLLREQMPSRNAFYAAVQSLDGQDGVEVVREHKGGGKYQFRGLRGVRLIPQGLSEMASRHLY